MSVQVIEYHLSWKYEYEPGKFSRGQIIHTREQRAYDLMAHLLRQGIDVEMVVRCSRKKEDS